MLIMNGVSTWISMSQMMRYHTGSVLQLIWIKKVKKILPWKFPKSKLKEMWLKSEYR